MKARSGTRKAVVVGAGSNGLTTAALLARAGWQVEVFERNAQIGGAASSTDALGPGTIVDLGAAGHPFGIASPVFADLELEKHGLRWLHSDYPLAHPLDDAPAALLHRDLRVTASGLGIDSTTWKLVHRGVVRHLDDNLKNLLAPMLRKPAHPVRLAQFGMVGAAPSSWMTRVAFRTEEAKALYTGSSAHSNAPLGHPMTSAMGVLFGALGMTRGWPVAEGGTQAVTNALAAVVKEHGGVIHTGIEITDLNQLPAADATVLNLTPAQIANLGGIDSSLRPRLKRWRYGPGAYKVDFLLDEPIAWDDPKVSQATTVHLGGTAAEIRLAEAQVNVGRMPDRPFVILCQQQAADPSRAAGPAAGKTVVWAYTRVPQDYEEPYPGAVADLIQAQIERFSAGLKISRRRISDPAALERWNPNLVGGDVAGGSMTGSQFMLRPSLTRSPYQLGDLYISSASTPPGGGVHGMPGYWAAQAILES